MVGVDYRPNPSTSYEHRVVDFGDFCETKHYGSSFDPNPPRRLVDKEKMGLAKKKLEVILI